MDHHPPAPPTRHNFFSNVFLTRSQLEAKIKLLEKENTFLRKHSGTVIASDGAEPCACCAATSKTLQSILTKHGASA